MSGWLETQKCPDKKEVPKSSLGSVQKLRIFITLKILHVLPTLFHGKEKLLTGEQQIVTDDDDVVTTAILRRS